jgi:hypothetical protein
MMRKLLVAPTFILAISNPIEVHSGRQAVFFRHYNFFFYYSYAFRFPLSLKQLYHRPGMATRQLAVRSRHIIVQPGLRS